MTSHPCTVAVDVGNTAIKLAVQKGQEVTGHTIAIDQTRWQEITIDWVRNQLGCGSTHWRVSSVHRRAAEKLIAAIKDDHRPASPATIDFVSHRDVPMPVKVDDPERLGIDRLLSAFAALQLIDLEQRAGGMVVIDAGSAITVDFVDHDSIFCGGSIMPGLELQARSLAAGTDALPQVSWRAISTPRMPATNTHDAISSGILLGAAGAIDRLIECLVERSLEPQSVSVILTGGDSEVLSNHIQRRHQCCSHLVCRGLLELR